MLVRPVASRRDQAQFLALPWQLHRDDPLWVPPLRGNQRELVGFARHPFYQTAASQAFLAIAGGEVLGRILAIDNSAHRQRYPQEECGFVGFFESRDDPRIAEGLFVAARQWLGQRGLKIVRGPVNPSLNYECGLLIGPFDRPPTFMMTYNPSYYPALWEGHGFVKAQDLLSFVGHKSKLQTMNKKILVVAQEARKRFDIKLRPLDPKRFLHDVHLFLDIYNRSNERNWGHVPMSPAEVTKASKGLRHLIVPALTQIAEVEGKPVGAAFGVLDYNPLIRQIDGRLFPLGFWKIWRDRHQLRRIRLVSTNVLPEYQMWGIGVSLAAYLVPAALQWPIHEGEFSWVLESNHLSRKTLERADLAVEKTHRIYEIAALPPC